MTRTRLVTGCAEFIGSHLSERLLAEGHRVIELDCFFPYCDQVSNERNLSVVRSHPRFSLIAGLKQQIAWLGELLPRQLKEF